MPVSFGRGSGDDFRCEGAGVWPGHFTIRLETDGQFRLTTCPEALCHVNGAAVADIALRNGDVIEAGAIKLSFGIADARQKPLSTQEGLAWILIVGLALAQAGAAVCLFQIGSLISP